MIAWDRKLERLSTCGVALSQLTLTGPVRGSLLSTLKGLTRLHNCIPISPPDATHFKTCHGTLTTVAPSLQVLTFILCAYESTLGSLCYVPVLPQGIHFKHLGELHLQWIKVACDTLNKALLTAATILKALTVVSMNLTATTTSHRKFRRLGEPMRRIALILTWQTTAQYTDR